MDKKALLEKTALVFGIAVILGAIWFWSLQVGDTLETLRLAYPD
jgi:hypothetical protein